MAKRVYADIAKFKKVEVLLRSATNSFRPVMSAIDDAMAGPRSEEEIAMLRSMRERTVNVYRQAMEVLHQLYLGVGGLED